MAAVGGVSRARAAQQQPWRGFAVQTHNFIGGEFSESKATKKIAVHNPATNDVVAEVPESTQDEMEEVRRTTVSFVFAEAKTCRTLLRDDSSTIVFAADRLTG